MCKEYIFEIEAPLAHYAKSSAVAPSDLAEVQATLFTEAPSHGFVDYISDELENLTRNFEELHDSQPVKQEPVAKFDYSSLIAAVKANDFQQVEQLCRTRGDMVSENGFTALHAAAAFGHLEVVETLLLLGSDTNRVTQAGSPLHCAVTSGNRSVIATLLFAQADPNARLWNGMTPLHLAAKKGDAWTVQKLLEAGAYPSTPDVNGTTPYEMATMHNAPPSLCNMLIEKEVELKFVNIDVDSFLENMDVDLEGDVSPFQDSVQVPLNFLACPVEVPAFG